MTVTFLASFKQGFLFLNFVKGVDCCSSTRGLNQTWLEVRQEHSFFPEFWIVVASWIRVRQESKYLRPTLDQGPRTSDQWIQAILLVEIFKLVWSPLDEGPRPKSGKLRLNLHGTCFGGKINRFGPKNSAKRRDPNLENQESG
jgi:hypothetical protein